MMTRSTLKMAALASFAALAMNGPVLAQEKVPYPVKTGTMIMQSSPGSGGDLFLRAVAGAASRHLDANLAVET